MCRSFAPPDRSTRFLTGMFTFLVPMLLLACVYPGFADADTPILRHEAPVNTQQKTLFDIFVLDQYRGLILVEYQEGSFRITAPEDLLEQLPEVDKKEKLLPLLEGTIERSRTIEGVGSIQFSSDTFRLVITPDSSLLRSRQAQGSDRLDAVRESERGLSLRADLLGSESYSSSSSSSNIFTHRVALNYRNAWLQADGVGDSASEYIPGEYSAHLLLGRFSFRAGFMQSPGQRFSGGAEFAGISIDTVEEVLTWNNTMRGSKLELLVPAKSVVRFYRGAELLDTQVLQSGFQQINTRAFPQGSYPVDIVMTDMNGNERVEKRYFAAAGLLALEGMPAYSLQLGELRDNFELLSVPYGQARTAVRILPAVQLEASLSGTDDVTLASLGFLGLQDNLIYGAGYGLSSEGKMGYYAQLSGFFGAGYSISADYDGNSADTVVEDSPIPPLDPIFTPTFPNTQDESFDSVNLLSRRRETLNFLFQKLVGEVSYRIIGASTTSATGRRDYRYGPSINWRIIQDRHDNLVFDLSYLMTEEGGQVAASLSYQHRFFPWSSEVQTSVTQGGEEDSIAVRPMLSYQNLDRANRGTEGRISSLLSHSTSGGESLQDSNSLEIRHTDRQAQFGGIVANSGTNSNPESGYTVYGGSSLIVSADGTLALSSPSALTAVLVADVAGSAKSSVTLLVDGSPYATIPVGSRTAVGLPPYRRYAVTIRPTETAEMVRVDDQKFEITLFPGNVVTRHWRADRVFIGVGRVVDKNGVPIAFVRIRGPKEYVVTDARGLFQVELTGAETLKIESDGHRCRLDLENHAAVGYVREFGDLVCR